MSEGSSQTPSGGIWTGPQPLGFSAYHARLVELGHGGPKPAPPHPYFAPALLAARSEALAAAVDATDRALARSIRGVARKAEAVSRRR